MSTAPSTRTSGGPVGDPRRVSRRSPVRGLLVFLAALVPVLLVGGPASAADPMAVTSPLTDPAILFDGDDRSAAQEAVDQLSTEHGIRLHAVFVQSFDSVPAETWAEQTAELSQLGESDILLAVAVGNQTYEYTWWVDENFPLTETDVEAALSAEVEPQLQARTWAGAVTALSGQLRSLASQAEATVAAATVEAAAEEATAAEEAEAAAPWSPTTILLIVGGIAAVLLVAHLLSSRRMPAESSGRDGVAA
jgi:uncharacterized membrane protein YgcG